MWTYINHQRFPVLMKAFDVKYDAGLLFFIAKRKVVDINGIPIFQLECKDRDNSLTTIYERFEWDDLQRLHDLYIDAVDKLIKKTHPIELGAIWTKTEIKTTLKPGSICFRMRGFHFRGGEQKNGEEDRCVYARSKNI
jgi:hypothetical protein